MSRSSFSLSLPLDYTPSARVRKHVLTYLLTRANVKKRTSALQAEREMIEARPPLLFEPVDDGLYHPIFVPLFYTSSITLILSRLIFLQVATRESIRILTMAFCPRPCSTMASLYAANGIRTNKTPMRAPSTKGISEKDGEGVGEGDRTMGRRNRATWSSDLQAFCAP